MELLRIRGGRRLEGDVAISGSKNAALPVMAASLLTEGWTLAGVAESFSGERFAAHGLERNEYNALRPIEGKPLDHPDMPEPVRFELPDWLYPHMLARFGARLEAEMEALSQPAPLDLRVNILKGTREAAQAALAAEGWEARPTPLKPGASPMSKLASGSRDRHLINELRDHLRDGRGLA